MAGLEPATPRLEISCSIQTELHRQQIISASRKPNTGISWGLLKGCYGPLPRRDEVRASNRNRTCDLMLTRHLLYRLSYTGRDSSPTRHPEGTCSLAMWGMSQRGGLVVVSSGIIFELTLKYRTRPNCVDFFLSTLRAFTGSPAPNGDPLRSLAIPHLTLLGVTGMVPKKIAR